jgi:hypothetical protein
VLLNAPPSKTARTGETVIENTVQETESTVNSSIPLLSLQFANALIDSEGACDLVLPSRWASEDLAPIPPAATGQSETCPSLLPYKDNSLLGDLTIRFDPKYCQIPNDAKVAEYRARLVIAADSSVEHVVHEGQAEFYLVDKLSERIHSFKCITDLSNAQSTPLVTMNYPQRVNFYSNDLSVVRADGPDFEKLFGRLHIDLPRVIRFILEHGKCNGKRDGNQALGHQKWRIQIGCCGQAHSGVVNGVNAPKSTYGLGIFDEINDPTERQSIKKMFADVLDCIQDCEDFVELKKLDKAHLFNDKKRLERFGAQLRDAIGTT